MPQGYGDNRLVLLPRDPRWMFAYWEITGDRINALRSEYGTDVWETGALVLRVYDVTDLSPTDGLHAPFFDIEVSDRSARQWYIQVPEAGHAYQVELGWRLPDGRFIALLRSNRIALPFGRISDKTDSQWMTFGSVAEQQAWEIASLQEPGIQGGSGRGSADFARTMAQRWEFLKSVFSAASSRLSSSGQADWMKPQPPGEDKTS